MWNFRAQFLRLTIAATLGLAGSPVTAQIEVEVRPTTIQAGQPVVLALGTLIEDCRVVSATSLQRNAGQVLVAIDLVPPPPNIICFGTPPQVSGLVEIGSFAAGSYTVSVSGTYNGEALQPGSASFVVTGASMARSIPATSLSFLLPLALTILGVGAALQLRDKWE